MNQHLSDTMLQYYNDLNENLAWLTQKTEESNVINQTLLIHPTQGVPTMQISHI